jgi:RHS repeat-associated protein
MSVNNAGLARAPGGVNALPLFYRYEYDQLNRLLRMRSYKGLNNASNQWTPLAINDYNEDVVYDPNGNILQYSRNGSPELSNPTAMDDLTYEYYSGKNQLKRVTDAVSSSNYTVDIDQQSATENYVYDAIGNLIEDKAEGITAIDWTVYGKISSIAKSGGTIRYVYDAAGNRVAKMYNGDTTIYVRDASGNVMSVYERKQTGAVEQLEVHLYGSSRLGMVTRRTAVDSLDIPLDGGYGNAKELTFTRAEKIFELSNHLGNVLVTISDRRLAVDDGNGDIAYYEADVVTANDYYPFGMLMPGRSYSATAAYRYGFNGKENDNEVKGEGGQQDYGMRIYDPRLGRFLSVDPLKAEFPWNSPYAFAEGDPILNIDLDGGEKKHYLLIKNGGNTTLFLSHEEDIYETVPIYTNSTIYFLGQSIDYRTKVGERTVKNQRAEYVVHGLVSYNLGLDGDMGVYDINVSWTFSSYELMKQAESDGGIGADKDWSWMNSDQSLSIGITIGLYNNLEAEFETGGMRGLWSSRGKLSNEAARKWYLSQEAKISSQLNSKLSLKAQARQAFELRNKIRTEARQLMKDQELAKQLDINEPNMSWDEIILKYQNEGYKDDALWNKIIEGSQKSRESVNQSLNVKPPINNQ